MNRWLPYAAALAIFLFGWALRGAYDRPDPEARARYDTLAARGAELDSSETARRRQDSLAVVRLAEVEAELAASRRITAALGQAAARLSDTIRVALPDTLLPLFDSLGVLHSAELAQKDVQIALQDSTILILNTRWRAADSAAAAANALLHQAVAQLNVATRRGRRGRFLLGVLAGGAAVYVATR